MKCFISLTNKTGTKMFNVSVSVLVQGESEIGVNVTETVLMKDLCDTSTHKDCHMTRVV